ncbi:MAG TPA: amidohydrolase family protein [Pyrinomonadaceae bacterium]|nr:amidohydrolase family protein [Pyrinomonadaceae bacterium]
MNKTIKSLLPFILCYALLTSVPFANNLPRTVSGTSAHASTILLTNGLWFDGHSFKPQTFYSVNGILRQSHSGKIDSSVDLQHRYIIPPFANAHTHEFVLGNYRQQIESYLGQGVFYAQNPNSLQKLTDPVRLHLNQPESVDVTFSNGGLTATGGHPIQIFDFIAEKGMVPGWTKEAMKNQAYFVVDTEADLDAQWELIKSSKPDFIKTYLEYSEEYETRKADPKYFGQRGLSPALLIKIVQRAHRDNLRVAVHVNTAMDFHNALVAKVDEIAHLPLAKISEADARLAAREKICVVTTTISHRKSPAGMDDIHRYNLELLRRQGVRLALGTDNNDHSILDEADNLYRLKVFDNLTLLKIWTEDTPAEIFPARKIGHLKDGYEASLLALDGNPLEEFGNLNRISFRLKQGHAVGTDKSQVKPFGAND